MCIKRFQYQQSPTSGEMVGKNSPRRSYSLEQVLTEQHISSIMKQVLKDPKDDYELICSEIKPAADGLCGFLGDHIRALLHVKVKDGVEKVHLFVKRLPMENKPKAEFIDENNFFKREKLMFRLLDEMSGAEGPNPWCARAYVCTDSLIVMPDLAVAGYSQHPLLETLNLQHVWVSVASIARYHAAFVNFDTRKTLSAVRPYNFYQEYKHLLVDPTFQDTPWVRTAAKLTADILDAFSTRFSKKNVTDLETKLATSYVQACDTLDVAEDSLNVMIHKDLWNNNILFKYEDRLPTNAIVIDYQCVRYGPPAFDLMAFLYLTTSKAFREKHESSVFKYYFQVFIEALDAAAKKHLEIIGYNEQEFLSWCEKSRMFGIFEAVAIYPQVLMDGKTAQHFFDDPDTFMSMVEQDRSGPVVEYARKHPVYKERQLEVSEEFVERYVLGQL